MASLVRLAYPDGKVARLFHRWMFSPRATHYQQFCVRLVEVALELPVRSFHDSCRAAHPKVRHCDELRSVDLEPWIVAVLQENVLAGMVLIDAVDYVLDVFSRFTKRDAHNGFGPQTKRRFTEMIGNTWVELQVPVGWELQFSRETRLAGYRGVAVIERCHLSQNTQHVNHAVGRMVGASRDDRPDVGYFDIECGFFPGYRVEGNEIIRSANATGYGLGICLPYTFITREIQGEEPSLQLRPRPTDQEVLDIAKRAVDRLMEEASEQSETLSLAGCCDSGLD